jgi:transcription elongation factor S-II
LQRLRLDIVEGRLQPEHLVHLTTSQLATDEVREERDQATKQADLARRGDLYEITRAAILQANGIDPNKGGEFCCRRCKGTKTTHYSLQTRSSDEPMTVFVCCLTCGNRWRCT